MSDEQVARRRFLQLAGKAAVTAPATSVLLAASTQMALPYGGSGGGQLPSSFIASPGFQSELSTAGQGTSPTDMGARGTDDGRQEDHGSDLGTEAANFHRLPGAVKPGKEFVATGAPPPTTPPW